MNAPALTPRSAAQRVLDYHRRTKHSLKAYAAGPEALDWEAQPNPFRRYAGAPRIVLPLAGEDLETPFDALGTPGAVAPVPLSLHSLAALLRLSLGISAWKELGPDRWALRCNPSSGNLHPTEAYVIAQGIPGLEDGLYHYGSEDHSLEWRCAPLKSAGTGPKLWVGLSSIHWREAWKYGERAFRYCQLDTGHALGALRYAAGALGWRAQVVDGLGTATLAALMGLDRAGDLAGAEAEDAELIVEFKAGEGEWSAPPLTEGAWHGQANRLDPHPLYAWPVIDDVALATGGEATGHTSVGPRTPLPARAEVQSATGVILGRRSAQRFTTKHTMSADAFRRLVDAVLPRAAAPFDVWRHTPQLHPVLFVHRVEGLEPGLYALPREPRAMERLRAGMRKDFLWTTPTGLPDGLPLFQLLPADARAAARVICCHQFIASDACFAVAMLAEFGESIAANPFAYRTLHWEAGLIGQALYLEAEAAGLRGTGIGCFFDDSLHELLGLEGETFQTLYHFTVGAPLTDSRITTLPAYPGRARESRKE